MPQRVAAALEQIAFARRYTLTLLDGLAEPEWFRMPAEGVTHIAWQVGHLAMGEFRLLLDRVRGPRPGDNQVISEEFLNLFGRDSVPDRDQARYPHPSEIRAVLDRVHERALADLKDFPDDELDRPTLKPHRLARTKGEVLAWCAAHEMLHAGQIALLRRLLGRPPLW